MHSVPSNPANILASAIRSARKNARKSNIRLRNACRDARRAQVRSEGMESLSRRTDKQRDSMKALVDRIDWAHCLKCKYACDGCVEYAYEASIHGVIGCKWLKIDERDANDILDGIISPS